MVEFDSLTDGERNYLIEHRADDEPPAHAVMVELPMLRAYPKMKAQQTGVAVAASAFL